MARDWKATFTTGREAKYETKQNSYRKYNASGETLTPISIVVAAREREFKSSSPMIVGPNGVKYRKARDYRRYVIVAPPSSAGSTKRYQTGYPARWVTDQYTNWKERSLLISGWASNPFHELISDNVSNRSMAEAMQRFNESKVQLANDLLEAKQTLNKVCDVAMQGARALMSARRGNFREAFSHLGWRPHGRRVFASDPYKLWLEFVYGWIPLAHELHAGQELLFKKVEESERLFVRSSRQCEETIVQRFDNRWAGYFEARGSITWTKSVKTVITGSPHFEAIATLRRWGLENPLSIAWEAVPYSFVVDWFMPIGNVISGFSASAGMDFLTASSTVKIKGQLSGTWRIDSLFGRSARDWAPFTEELELTRRHSHTSWPWPMVYVKNPFSTNHVMSALALISNVRR